MPPDTVGVMGTRGSAALLCSSARTAGGGRLDGDGAKIEVRVDSFVEFCAEEGEQIEQRGASSFTPPLRESSEAVGSVRTELEDAGEQDHAVTGDRESWLARNGE